MLKVENINISFGERQIFKDLSLNIGSKKIITITGKSGSGKSTLLGIVSGMLKPDSGKVYFNGKDIFRWGDLRRSRFRNREMGFVFQFFNLIEDMTAYENILYPVSLNIFAAKNIEREIDSLIELLDLGKIIKQYPSTLSGGEMQRVAIARAIVNNPSFILADEPTGNVDEETTDDIINLFKKLKKERGITTVLATHERRLIKDSDINYHIEDAVLKRHSLSKRKTGSKSKSS